MRRRRFLIWRGIDSCRAESAEVDLGPLGLRARGAQIGTAGVRPAPHRGEVVSVDCRYRLDYELETDADLVTTRLIVVASSEEWRRRLDLAREQSGRWTVATEGEGAAQLGDPGGDVGSIAGAFDCDLGLSPLTNFMPVKRERLLEGREARDFVMAWVAVPGLSVHRSEQRYEPIDERTVRYVGKHRSFIGELDLDEEGFVVRYPGLAERV